MEGYTWRNRPFSLALWHPAALGSEYGGGTDEATKVRYGVASKVAAATEANMAGGARPTSLV